MIIPNKNMWKRWSLPSKLTAIGALLGLVSLVFSLIIYFIPTGSSEIDQLDIGPYLNVEVNYRKADLANFKKKGVDCKNKDNCEKRLTDEFFRYVNSQYYKEKLDAGNAIISSAMGGGIIYLLITYAHLDLDEIAFTDSEGSTSYGFNFTSDYAFDEKGTEGLVSLVEFGIPVYLLENMVVILEDPEKLKNGFNIVGPCEGSPVFDKLSGFYRFEYQGSHQGIDQYHGYLAQVDVERAMKTVHSPRYRSCH